MKRKWMVFVVVASCALAAWAGPPETVRGVYLGPYNFGEHKITAFIHYAKLAGLNAAVLHMKDPHGWLQWDSQNATAKEVKAVKSDAALPAALKRLKEAGIWTIAKQDVFQDTALAEGKPEWAVQDVKTGKQWRNKNKLGWTNPYDKRVWEYNIALAKELAALGFDEIQFDYIRFPSDGTISTIKYPVVLEGKSKVETIGAYLEEAHKALEPLGATLSVDLFGFVAWKKDDFGVGQRIEEIAPHVDAVCPMLYPSHFPSGFLGKKSPSAFPKEIMERSMKELQQRTKVTVRPWIQGFWYTPDEIIAQLEGVEAAGVKHCLIWNPASNYDKTYAAFAKRLKTTFPAPKYYADLADLEKQATKEVKGIETVVQFTDYKAGYSRITVEQIKDQKSPYGGLTAVLKTLDEAVMDQILRVRKVASAATMKKDQKTQAVLNLWCKDTGISAKKVRVQPFYVNWRNDCRFTATAPAEAGTNPAVQATP